MPPDPDHAADARAGGDRAGRRKKGHRFLARLCQEKLAADPFSGCVFVFRSRSGTAIRLLTYDGQGYWLATKRLSKGRFKWWPTRHEAGADAASARGAVADGGRRIRVPSGADVAAGERVRKARQPPLRSNLTLAHCDRMPEFRYRGRTVTDEDISFIRRADRGRIPRQAAARCRRNCARPGSGSRPMARCATWSAAACC